jgi:hypothetical protein
MFQTGVLNFDNLNFEFVSDFDIRISDFIINFRFRLRVTIYEPIYKEILILSSIL